MFITVNTIFLYYFKTNCCDHSLDCPCNNVFTNSTSNFISSISMGVLFYYGITKNSLKSINNKEFRNITSNIIFSSEQEKIVYQIIKASGGNIYQSDIIRRSNLPDIIYQKLYQNLRFNG